MREAPSRDFRSDFTRNPQSPLPPGVRVPVAKGSIKPLLRSGAAVNRGSLCRYPLTTPPDSGGRLVGRIAYRAQLD